MSSFGGYWPGFKRSVAAPVTNLLHHSDDFTNAAWNSSAGGVTLTPNYMTGPNGNPATRMQVTSGHTTGVKQTVPNPSSSLRVVSVYGRSNTGVDQVLAFYYPGVPGGLTTTFPADGSWVRMYLAIGAALDFDLYNYSSAAMDVTLGDPQMEVGSGTPGAYQLTSS